MATITVTPTVEASNVPPRVRLDIADSGTPAVTQTTVTRLNPDGSLVPVRTYDGNPVALTSGTALLYDYEAPYGQAVSYSSTESASVVSAQVTVPETRIWLVHPGVPALSTPITVQSWGEVTVRATQGVFWPMGRSTPVVVTDGARKSAQFTLTVLTGTSDEAASMAALLGDLGSLLLNIPASKNAGRPTGYVAVGDVQVSRPSRITSEAARLWTLDCTDIDRPVGGSQAQRTYVDLLSYPTYAALQAAYPSYTALLAGP